MGQCLDACDELDEESDAAGCYDACADEHLDPESTLFDDAWKVTKDGGEYVVDGATDGATYVGETAQDGAEALGEGTADALEDAADLVDGDDEDDNEGGD